MIKDWRLRLKLTKSQMARYLRCPISTYVQWESGERKPSQTVNGFFDVLKQIEVLYSDYHNQLINEAKHGG